MSKRPPRRPAVPPPLPVPPPQPPPTAEEIAAKERVIAQWKKLAEELQQRNLNNAVLLAQEAARGRGPLVEHFAELGRRFAGTLSETPPKLRVIEGGAATHRRDDSA